MDTEFPFSVHLINAYPVLGVAVTVIEDPELNIPPPLVVPPAEGFDDNDTVSFTAAAVKLATNVLFELKVKV